MTDPVAGWDAHPVAFGGHTRTVLRRGAGPGVIVAHEVPGITPPVLALGERLVDDGFTVVMPVFFGRPGEPRSRLAEVRSLAQALRSRQFSTLRPGRTSPVTIWLRALAGSLHAELGGPGVGVVGLCISGSLALTVATDEAVVASVMSEPCVPLAVTPWQRRDLGVSPADLARVKERVASGRLEILGLHYSADWLAPATRFATATRQFGAGFRTITVASGRHSRPSIPRCAHSVMTLDPALAAAEGAQARLDEVTGEVRRFLADRLHPPTAT